MDRGAWQATVRGVAKNWKRLRYCHSLPQPTLEVDLGKLEISTKLQTKIY